MKKKKDYKIEYVLPQMSWEVPIEQEILKFTRAMRINMEQVANRPRETGWFANNRLQEEAEKMALAYRTVEKHILREIELRRKD
jgi:glycine cleavage system H lipoate-binding protein